jgi:signal peptidase I
VGAVAELRHHFVVIRVEGKSMEPTFRHRSIVFARRIPIYCAHHGDIVIFCARDLGPCIPRYLIKRVVGVAGDERETIIRELDSWSPGGASDTMERKKECVIPEGYFIVGGDNAESLSPEQIGLVSEDDVIGVKTASRRFQWSPFRPGRHDNRQDHLGNRRFRLPKLPLLYFIWGRAM